MTKVLLITSREFQNFIDSNFAEIDPYIDIETIDQRGTQIAATEKTKYLGLFFDDIWGLLPDILKNVSTVGQKKETIKNKIAEKKIHRKNNGDFVLGIWKKKLSDSEYIYMADEYPPIGGGNEGKFKYLNALVDEIKNNIKTTAPIEWTIISHDQDWGISKLSEIIKAKGENQFKSEYQTTINDAGISLEDFAKLKEIVSDPNTHIALFQHEAPSEWYQFAKNIVPTMSVIDVVNFLNKGSEQKLIFKKYIQHPNDDHWKELMQIDTNYPFMPFDIVENPLKEESYSK